MGSSPRMLLFRNSNSSVLYYDLAAKEADDLHDHAPVHQVSIPLIGQPTMQFNHKTKSLTSDDLTITSPGNQHRNFSSDEAVRYLIINLDRDFTGRVFTEATGKVRDIEFDPWGTDAQDYAQDHYANCL